MARTSAVTSSLFDDVLARASDDLAPVVRDLVGDHAALHLAVFVEPYLSYVFDRSKTVESRFSTRAIPPYRCVTPGDVILLKPTGKPITGWCRAGEVWDYRLDPASWDELRDRFSPALRAQDGFWESREGAQFATLFQVQDVHRCAPTPVGKRDRRGWVVLANRCEGRLP